MAAPQGRDRWALVNPLPHALAHYEQALRIQVGPPVSDAIAQRPDFEVGVGGRWAKAWRGVRAVTALLRVMRGPSQHLVIWPALGVAELAFWRLLARERCLVIIHDPEPLREQHGYGRIGRWMARWGSRGGRVEVVAHTELAADALRAMGVRVSHILPHPALPSTVDRPPTTQRKRIQVLGQHKRARDLELLGGLASAAPATWDLRISGRGWPDVPGWRVTDRFLSESELSAELAAADAVLLPYQHYFQSGIVVRAFELGVPVAGWRHEFVESFYGAGWPGLADGRDVESLVTAIDRVLGLPVPNDPAALLEGRGMWQQALSNGSGGSHGRSA